MKSSGEDDQQGFNPPLHGPSGNLSWHFQRMADHVTYAALMTSLDDVSARLGEYMLQGWVRVVLDHNGPRCSIAT